MLTMQLTLPSHIHLQDGVPMSIMHPVPDTAAGWRFVEKPDLQFPECSAAPFAGLDLQGAPPMLVVSP